MFSLQNKVYKFSKAKNFRRLFIYQTVFSNSFFVRVYVVKNVLDDFSKVFNDFFIFDSVDKMNLSIHLRNYRHFSSNKLFLNQLFRSHGMCSNYPFVDVYDFCLDFLTSFFFLPVLDAWSGKSYYKFKPYIEDDNYFLYLYYSLLARDKLNFCALNGIDFPFYFFDDFFVLKDFPVRRKLLLSWLDLNAILLQKNYYSFLFCNLIDFLFVGLLRLGFVNTNLYF